jgi:hypothetical protein
MLQLTDGERELVAVVVTSAEQGPPEQSDSLSGCRSGVPLQHQHLRPPVAARADDWIGAAQYWSSAASSVSRNSHAHARAASAAMHRSFLTPTPTIR